MKQLLMFFICILFFNLANAQYYKTPEWVKDLPYSVENNEIYAIGISDPRMIDNELAKKIAINRAITMSVLFSACEVNYVSDYFEKQSEEYKWYTVKENVQEFGKLSASAYVDKNSYSVIYSEVNENYETIVLIKLNIVKSDKPNFFVNAEYYCQNFEVNNLRDYESIKNIKLYSDWLLPNNKDSLKTSFFLTNIDSDINCYITYDNIEIKSPGYSYQYYSNLSENFDLKDFNASSNLVKGLWIAYIDSFIQNALKISKNTSSKFKTVSDDYKVNRNDGISEAHLEKLSRISVKNNLSFEYGGFGIYNNFLYPRLYLKSERKIYIDNNISVEVQNNNPEKESVKEGKKKECWFKRMFLNKNK